MTFIVGSLFWGYQNPPQTYWWLERNKGIESRHNPVVIYSPSPKPKHNAMCMYIYIYIEISEEGQGSWMLLISPQVTASPADVMAAKEYS